jgi:hypothetical protein
MTSATGGHLLVALVCAEARSDPLSGRRAAEEVLPFALRISQNR